MLTTVAFKEGENIKANLKLKKFGIGILKLLRQIQLNICTIHQFLSY